MRLIDTHTHLYQPKFDSDREEAVARCFSEGVDTLLLPNIDLESVPRVLSMMEKWPDSCFGMMGLHPCHVGEGWEVELDEIRKVLDAPPKGKKFIAVGEIGIDLYWETKHIEAQREAFRIQVGWAKERGIPIVIHVRNAWDALFEEMDKLNDDSLTGVFHCFTGDLSQANRAISLGMKLGIGGVLTFKNGGLDRFIDQIDLSHLVLETDAPYLAPVPYRGKRNASAYLPLVAEKLALLTGKSLEDIAAITTENSRAVFGV